MEANSNPFGWADSSDSVKSPVITLAFQDADGTNILYLWRMLYFSVSVCYTENDGMKISTPIGVFFMCLHVLLHWKKLHITGK